MAGSPRRQPVRRPDDARQAAERQFDLHPAVFLLHLQQQAGGGGRAVGIKQDRLRPLLPRLRVAGRRRSSLAARCPGPFAADELHGLGQFADALGICPSGTAAVSPVARRTDRRRPRHEAGLDAELAPVGRVAEDLTLSVRMALTRAETQAAHPVGRRAQSPVENEFDTTGQASAPITTSTPSVSITSMSVKARRRGRESGDAEVRFMHGADLFTVGQFRKAAIVGRVHCDIVVGIRPAVVAIRSDAAAFPAIRNGTAFPGVEFGGRIEIRPAPSMPMPPASSQRYRNSAGTPSASACTVAAASSAGRAGSWPRRSWPVWIGP